MTTIAALLLAVEFNGVSAFKKPALVTLAAMFLTFNKNRSVEMERYQFSYIVILYEHVCTHARSLFVTNTKHKSN